MITKASMKAALEPLFPAPLGSEVIVTCGPHIEFAVRSVCQREYLPGETALHEPEGRPWPNEIALVWKPKVVVERDMIGWRSGRRPIPVGVKNG